MDIACHLSVQAQNGTMTPITRRRAIAAALAAPLASQRAQARPAADGPAASRRLWPTTPPGLLDPALAPRITERSTDPAAYRDRAIDHVRDPYLDIFPAANPNGAAVLITPGGGYQRVVIDKEGHELAAWLAARGVSAFVLFYRLPDEGWENGRDVPLADAQRAMRLIRHWARDYRIDPARVAALGFSAGGHLCADLATRFDRRVHGPVDDADALDARPMLAAPIYPVVSMDPAIAHAGSRARLIGAGADAASEAAYSPDRNLSSRTPPLFLAHAEDDDVVPVENTLRLRAAAKAARVPVETHLFEEGGHGFGLRLARGKPAQIWPQLFLDWAVRHGLTG